MELFFLHYHSEKEAKEKWARRIKRISWDRLLVKFNVQNGCAKEQIKAFDALPFKNKVCFPVKEYQKCKLVVHIKAPRTHEFVRSSYEVFGRKITDNLNEL